MGGLSHLFVRVELGLGCYDGGKFLGRLLCGDGNTCTTQRWSSLHPGCHLSRLVISVPWVPHGSEEERQNIFRCLTIKLRNKVCLHLNLVVVMLRVAAEQNVIEKLHQSKKNRAKTI